MELFVAENQLVVAQEKDLHYVLDVTFEEDASLADVGYAAENMALLRRLAMNVIVS